MTTDYAVSECRQGQRPVSVSDTIEMRRLGVPSYMDDDPPSEIAQFSPDGSRFALILKQGNLKLNAMDYSLLVYDTRTAVKSRHPSITVTMSSTSNREGIKMAKWLTGGRTLLFIGENRGGIPQIYSLDVQAKRVKRVTDHPTAVISYDASDDGSVIVFEADPPVSNIVDTPQTRRDGFVVARQNLNEILLAGDSQANSFTSRQLFLLHGRGKPRRIRFDDGVWPILSLSVSPNGRYALVEAFARHVPPSWMEYKDKLVHEFIAADKDPSALSLVETYLLLDTTTGKIVSLLDSPKSWEHDGYVWIAGGNAIVISRSFLPLQGIDEKEKGARKKQTFVVEVELPSRQIVKIGNEAFVAMKWEPNTKGLLLQGPGEPGSESSRFYRKIGREWKEVSRPSEKSSEAKPSVSYEDGMNSPPKVWITDAATGNKTMLLDLNPQFKDLCLAEEKAITWKATDGHAMEGGLYLPPEYHSGQHLPLVIQTHAFNAKHFWMDGPWSSAFAAQALAAKGIAVLQVGGSSNGGDRPFRSTPEEATRQMAAFEGAIDSLGRQGVIDPNRVGIIGFSRTVYHVAYTLTHSKFHFAAATLADGFDGGYFQALAFPTMAVDFNAVNGGPPFGATLYPWLNRSPGFNLARVDAPVRLEGYSVAGALEEWEWYSLLAQMKKPVDFLLLPQATHLLVKPWERMASQQGNVDWFAFWLKGYEDPYTEKLEQYIRWHHLRKLQVNGGTTPQSGEDLR